MKKPQFNIIQKHETFQILGGITDPNNDPDDKDTAPVDNPVAAEASGNPVDKQPNPRRTA